MVIQSRKMLNLHLGRKKLKLRTMHRIATIKALVTVRCRLIQVLPKRKRKRRKLSWNSLIKSSWRLKLNLMLSSGLNLIKSTLKSKRKHSS